jgi:hypothetical protein
LWFFPDFWWFFCFFDLLIDCFCSLGATLFGAEPDGLSAKRAAIELEAVMRSGTTDENTGLLLDGGFTTWGDTSSSSQSPNVTTAPEVDLGGTMSVSSFSSSEMTLRILQEVQTLELNKPSSRG